MAAAATVGQAVRSATAVSGGGAISNNVSLYVGDLDKNVNETQLYDLFNQVGQVITVRVCRDLIRNTSLGYAYVNFSNPQDGNYTPFYPPLPLSALLFILYVYVCACVYVCTLFVMRIAYMCYLYMFIYVCVFE